MSRREKPKLPVDPLWYKDAVIYQLHVKSFMDSNGDGIGDFKGLLARLDHVVELGANTIWILPFYPSPRRDDGYDIAEYRKVSPDYGTMADFRRFVKAAHEKGIRVITELVINHTSDQHPWFQRARRAKKGSAARDFYVWSDTDKAYSGTRIIFIDTEKSNWTWDEVAGQYFWHRFYSHQPDLNFDNPKVLKEILSIMKFWLDTGVDGLRLDAIPYLIEREGTNNENLPETHAVLKKIRAEMDRLYPGKMLLAEANQWPEDTQAYFGDGDECNMSFHFPLMPRMYMAIAQEDRFPISDILRQTPKIPENCQWAIFLRNHDELTLEMVTDKERDYLWETYAADRRARLNLGIRRRLAPLVQRDRRRIELMNGLLLSMPGTPVLYYGDEIGMGDNIYLGDRDGVRTPMQWSIDRNGGFSKGDPAKLVLPPIMDPAYGYQAVNVEAQSADPHSLLNWTRRMLAVRKQTSVFGRGEFRLLAPGNRKVLAYLRTLGDDVVLCVNNLSRTAQAVELDLAQFAGRVPVDMIGGSTFPPIGQLTYLLTLPAYGFYWFTLGVSANLPSWHKPVPEQMPEYITLVLRKSVAELQQPGLRKQLEEEILPTYLPKRRWFAAKDAAPPKLEVTCEPAFPESPHPVVLCEIRLAGTGERYQLPLTILWEDEIVTALPQQLALARVRIGRRVGLLTDAFAVESFPMMLLEHLQKGSVLERGEEQTRFIPTVLLKEYEVAHENPQVRPLAVEQSNSTVVIEDKVIIKLLRRIENGIHPEAEVGAYLAEHGYRNTSPALGEIRRVAPDGEPRTLAVVQGFLRNQGDGWTWALGYLSRALEDAALLTQAGHDGATAAELMAPYEAFGAMIGKRLGELHACLAQPSDDSAFAPEAAGKSDVAAWEGQAQDQLDRALEALAAAKANLDPESAAAAAKLLDRRRETHELLRKMANARSAGLKTRIHGDFHLGQILVVQNDIHIIDFEGEPAKPLKARRGKASPLRDVAGILRSFDYAAAATVSNRPPTSPKLDEQQLDLLQSFTAAVSEAFRKAYQAVLAEAPHPWIDLASDDKLLRMFLIEKAAYEICYEAANRPAWIAFPLRGLTRLLDRKTEKTLEPHTT
ncbi:maltose alpha-D-glucosyltransferase [Dongia sedimenti]|uniref:Maltokinase n=1 Tax=Dongia sedimenti TaxID=3064282 RepID=A0ABU0YWA2_9PROT|nr:maltose alpha-D-glucosyltransferase [Rhodospirillaceae bacterium R-7]